MKRVLVVIQGGLADWAQDEGVEVVVFDKDTYVEGDGGVPHHFADLAAPWGLPVEEEEIATDEDRSYGPRR